MAVWRYGGMAVWLFGSTLFAALLQVLQLSVLARKLEAHELGLLAIINAILRWLPCCRIWA